MFHRYHDIPSAMEQIEAVEVGCPNDGDDCDYCPHYEVTMDEDLFSQIREDYLSHNSERRALADTLQQYKETMEKIIALVTPMLPAHAVPTLMALLRRNQ